VTSPWPLVKLGDVANLLKRGISPKYSEYSRVRVINQRCIRNSEIDVSLARYHDVEQKPIREELFLSQGDLLVNSTGVGTVGRSAVIENDLTEKLTLDSHVTLIRSKPELVYSFFLKMYFQLIQQKIESLAEGSGGQVELSRTAISAIDIPLPPLDEQKRIVAKLDDALGVVEELKANTAKAKSELDALWQSALTQTFSGEWPMVKLGEVCNVRTGKKDVNEGSPTGEYPFFTCAKEHTYSDSFSFDCEAILVAGNGNVGQTTYYLGKFEAYQRTYVLSDFKTIYASLLHMYLDGMLVNHLKGRSLGNTIPYIKLGMLVGFEIPCPPLDEQKRIVARLDEIKIGLDRQREILVSKELETERLRSSILTAAFSGEM
jgi:type I restriction enzyme S subunit